MSAQQYLSYTYLIGWTKYDLWYYGSRKSSTLDPKDDLWIIYHTSSDLVKKLVPIIGDPDVIHIDKTFEIDKEARLYEVKVLKEHKVVDKFHWLNLNDSPCPPTNKKTIEF